MRLYFLSGPTALDVRPGSLRILGILHSRSVRGGKRGVRADYRAFVPSHPVRHESVAGVNLRKPNLSKGKTLQKEKAEAPLFGNIVGAWAARPSAPDSKAHPTESSRTRQFSRPESTPSDRII